jgi:hypothetical protein
MNENQEREAFEVWVQASHSGEVGKELIGKEENSPRIYVFSGVNQQWRAWQARAALAAKAPADPCLVLWQAMNEAEKFGNRSDDKLIVEFLRRAGYVLAAAPAPAPEATPAQAQQAEPNPDTADAERYRWLRARENANRDEWNLFGPYSSPAEIDATIDAARGIGASSGGGNG